jgi:hypothetical protein
MTDPSTVITKPALPTSLFGPEPFVFVEGWEAELGVGLAEGDGPAGVGEAAGELDSAGGTVVPELPPELPPPGVCVGAAGAGAVDVMSATIPVQLPPAASCTVRRGWNKPPPKVWVADWPVADVPSSNAHEKV